jgi:hypothetical protein
MRELFVGGGHGGFLAQITGQFDQVEPQEFQFQWPVNEAGLGSLWGKWSPLPRPVSRVFGEAAAPGWLWFAKATQPRA